MDPSKGLFRRRPSSASTRSRLRPQASTGGVTTAQSCPTSPKHTTQGGVGSRRSLGGQKIPEDEEAHLTPTTSSEAAEYAAAIEASRQEYAAAVESSRLEAQHQRQELQQQQPQQPQQQKTPTRNPSRSPRVSSAGSRLTGNSKSETKTGKPNNGSAANSTGGNNGSPHLQRSASNVSGLGIRPRSSPAGLHSYTGSVPSSVHGSRVDLRDPDKGSAIYLGCSAPRNSTLSLASSRGSSASSAPPSPARTPPVSPRHGVRRSISLIKKQR